jgi:CAAX prenyl protease-like protein
VGVVLAAIRLFGAVIVVPVMEELFWRSFLIRYLVTPTFTMVPLGTFTPLSFGATVVLFGLEHHLWLAGMLAGAAYNLILYKTRRLWPCILAHALTNLLLGIHVLRTGEWHWW